ncbi:hypothetical protein MRB53_035994 [Persea americana]|uniref:Uncharacterized protein n=1 Tax=Persea americana TaxID=3435 RepID=A0ACC2K6N2_PERAE|nr:hypothetical protein MRB53_035994 [Persea americana]
MDSPLHYLGGMGSFIHVVIKRTSSEKGAVFVWVGDRVKKKNLESPHSRWDKTSIITVTMAMMILSAMHILVLLSEGEISYGHHNYV